MSWYKQGTCNVTNNSAVVTGTGTLWVANVNAGSIFVAPDHYPYEILSVNADGSMTLASVYRGSTASTQAYSIAPTQDFSRQLALQIGQLTNDYANLMPYNANDTHAAGSIGETLDHLNAGYVDAAKYGVVYGSTTTDMSSQLRYALTQSSRILISGILLISSQIDATNKDLYLTPNAQILINQSTFTGAKYTTTGAGIVFTGGTGSLQGGLIKPKTYVDDRDTVAIRVVNGTRVKLMNTNYTGFSKANGIIDIVSSNQTQALFNNFYSCSTSSSTNGQITGIVVDDNKVAGVPSYGTQIIGNTFKDLTVSTAFKTAFGVQTDGVNIQTFSFGTVCNGNYFENVGEGIDVWGDYGSYTGNTAKDCKIFAYKLIHGASYNTWTGNTAWRSGLAAFVLSGSNTATKHTVGNVITGGTFGEVDSFGDWTPNGTACILVLGTGLTYQPLNNHFADVGLVPGAAGKYAIFSDSNGSGNTYSVRILGSGTVQRYAKSDGSTEIPLVQDLNPTRVRITRSSAQSIAPATDVRLTFDTKTVDRRGEYLTTGGTAFRWYCEITGYYDVDMAIRFPAVTTGKIFSLFVRKNGGGVAYADLPAAAGSQTFVMSDSIYVKEGEYLEFFINHNDTVTRSLDGANSNIRIRAA